MENLKYFKGSILVTVSGLIAAALLGSWEALFITMILAVLEVSLSFDNAVVNATVLKDMDEKWRRRFLTWGILIAVFGMRIVFPIIIVSVIAGLTPWSAFDVAVNNPEQYAAYMSEAHTSLMLFGGSFLMLVGLEFFIDYEKEDHWIPILEKPTAWLDNHIPHVPYVITFIVVICMSLFAVPDAAQTSTMFAGFAGIGVFGAIALLTNWLEEKENQRAATHAVAKSGFAMFMYLEILDASFSFDGVIGAFAITNNIFIIAIGLGIGAMFVRSLTIFLVEKDTLSQFKWLEHGAFYAIVALATIMMLKVSFHIPELVTGLIGAAFIGAAVITSGKLEKLED